MGTDKYESAKARFMRELKARTRKEGVLGTVSVLEGSREPHRFKEVFERYKIRQRHLVEFLGKNGIACPQPTLSTYLSSTDAMPAHIEKCLGALVDLLESEAGR